MKSTLTQKLSAALLGLSLASTAAVADTTNLLTLMDFDTTGFRYYNGAYHYNWGFAWPGSTETFINDYEQPYATNLVAIFSYDNSLVAPFFATNNPSSGYGFGVYGGIGWDGDASKFVGTNKEDYIVEFDCRVEGLSNSVTAGNGEFQIRFDQTNATMVQLNYGFQAGSNWTHYKFLLSQGYIPDDGGNWPMFVANRASIDNLHMGCNWHQSDPQFGFDADNVVILDNIALYAVDRAPVIPPPTTPYAIVDWNMDDKGLLYGWAAGTNGGWSQNGVKATYLLDWASAGTGQGGSNSIQFWMINEIYATNSPLPTWAGGNGGFGGPGNYAQVRSPSLADYRLSMDARVEGLDPAATAADFDFQVRFVAPAPLGSLVRCDCKFYGVSSNWTHVEIKLNQAVVGEGSAANFAANYSQVTEVAPQVQLNNVARASLWGFDADNKLFLDNIKLEYISVECPPITITPSGSDVVLTWPPINTGGYVQVQRKATLTDPVWVDVPGATNSPVTLPHTNAAGFYRTNCRAK